MKKFLLYLMVFMGVFSVMADSQSAPPFAKTATENHLVKRTVKKTTDDQNSSGSQQRWNKLPLEDKAKYYLANAALYPTLMLAISLKLLVSQETAHDYIAPVFDPVVDELFEKTQY